MKVSEKILEFNVALAYAAHLRALVSLIKSTIIKHWKRAVSMGLSVDYKIETIAHFYPKLKVKTIQDTSVLCKDKKDYITIWSQKLFDKKKPRRVVLCFNDLGIRGSVDVRFYNDKNQMILETSIKQTHLIEEGFIFAVTDWIEKLTEPIITDEDER